MLSTHSFIAVCKGCSSIIEIERDYGNDISIVAKRSLFDAVEEQDLIIKRVPNSEAFYNTCTCTNQLTHTTIDELLENLREE